jgi:Ca2+-binding RTX toxin-like protein
MLASVRETISKRGVTTHVQGGERHIRTKTRKRDAGNDTYYWSLNGGNDRIADSAGTDLLRLGPGVLPSQVRLSQTAGLDLVLLLPGGSVTLANWQDAAQRIEYIQFEDGTIWDETVISRKAGLSTAVNDVRFEFLPGDGQSTIEYGAGQGVIAFPNVALSDLTVTAETRTDGWQYLKVAYSATDAVLIQGGFLSSYQRFEVAGISYSHAEFLRLLAPGLNLIGTLGPDTLYGGNLNDTLTGYLGNYTSPDGNDSLDGQGGDDILSGGLGDDTLIGGDGNDSLTGDGGNDTLDGGAGIDRLVGYEGNDTYRFGRASGQDTIVEADSTGTSLDTVQLDAGILPADVSLLRNGNDLILALDQGTAQLTVSNYFLSSAANSAYYKIEQIQFADGTLWNNADIDARVPVTAVNAFTGTAGNDSYVVDNALDSVSEHHREGIDATESNATYRWLTQHNRNSHGLVQLAA